MHSCLEHEYFPRIEELGFLLAELGMDLAGQQFTPITWVVWAWKSAVGIEKGRDSEL